MLAALFASVADAVISYTIDKLDPAEQIKHWLRRDPVTLAFQKSLARTYSAFVRQYPDYANSLFDKTFLSTKTVPELSKLLGRNQHPDPALLAQAWGESLGAGVEFSKRAMKPASDFLLWLEAELKGEQALQPLFDSRALDDIEVGIEKLTQEIQRGLESALKAANGYQIQIGGNVTHSNIVIGDNNSVNQYFYSGDFVSLNEYYIPPDGVFQRVRVDEFVGRDWLTAKVDAFLNDPNRKSGAFLLIGDAGVGKTSFMTHLVKERRYLHLFAEQVPGQAMLQRALQSLGSQLVTRYQIDPYKDRDTLTQLAVFPDFLERLLRLAASTLTNGEKIVIVCDALDEAGTFPDHFVFGLPKELPDGVYFILSQRPANVKLPNFEPVIEKLEAQGEDNLQDMQDYLSAVAKRPEVAGQIRPKGYSENFFIQTLKEKSQGVWMYLHYVIKEIESGARAPLDLANLPTGLVGYYAEYWDAWRTGKRGKGEEAWDELYAPLLTTLAAAQEAMTVEQLIQWADVPTKPREVIRLLNDWWRAFIAEKELDGKKAYSPYHLSFKDFIIGRVDTDKLSPAQANLVKDLAAQTVDAHKRIVRAFEAECHGEWEKLTVQDYPRLYLSAHLVGAGKYETLRILLTEGDEKIKWAEAREKKEETYAGYLNDLTYVWDYAEREQNYALAIRCMLIENSIHSLASNIPPELLFELAKAGIWSYARCLEIIRESSFSYNQAKSLNLIVPALPSLLFRDALAVTSEIGEEEHRAQALAFLTPYLNERLIRRALVMAGEIQDKYHRAKVLVSLMPYLDRTSRKGVLQEFLATVREIKDRRLHALTLAALGPQLSYKLKKKAFVEACEIKDEFWRAEALKHLTPYLNDKLKTKAFIAIREIKEELWICHTLTSLVSSLSGEFNLQVLAVAREISNKEYRTETLVSLVPHIEEKLKEEILQEALTSARQIEGEIWHVKALASLMPYFSGKMREGILQEGLAVARKITKESDYVESMILFMPYLTGELKEGILRNSLAAARKIEQEFRARTLASLIPYLDNKLKQIILQEALTAARKIDSAYGYAVVLDSLAPYLNDVLKLDALSVAREIKEDRSGRARARALASLVPYINVEFGDSVLQEALDAACEIPWDDSRSEALARLMPYLNDELRKKAFSIVRNIKTEAYRTDALASIAPYLDDNLKTQALASMSEITHREELRVKVLKHLAPRLSEQAKEMLLDVVFEIEWDTTRAHALEAIAPHVNGDLQTRTLRAIRKIRFYPYGLARGLISIAPYLNRDVKEEVLQEALIAAREITWIDERVTVLAELALLVGSDFKESIIQEALVAAHEIKPKLHYSFAHALISLTPHLQDEFKNSTIQEVLEAIRKIEDESSIIELLDYVAPHLENETITKALTIAHEIKREDHRARSLASIAPHLDFKMQLIVLQEILYLQGHESLRKALDTWMNIGYRDLDKNIVSFAKFTARKDRESSLVVLGILTPALVHFRGPEIALELFRAIQDTARWWP